VDNITEYSANDTENILYLIHHPVEAKSFRARASTVRPLLETDHLIRPEPPQIEIFALTEDREEADLAKAIHNIVAMQDEENEPAEEEKPPEQPDPVGPTSMLLAALDLRWLADELQQLFIQGHQQVPTFRGDSKSHVLDYATTNQFIAGTSQIPRGECFPRREPLWKKAR
jgi:hypothetical protein